MSERVVRSVAVRTPSGVVAAVGDLYDVSVPRRRVGDILFFVLWPTKNGGVGAQAVDDGDADEQAGRFSGLVSYDGCSVSWNEGGMDLPLRNQYRRDTSDTIHFYVGSNASGTRLLAKRVDPQRDLNDFYRDHVLPDDDFEHNCKELRDQVRSDIAADLGCTERALDLQLTGSAASGAATKGSDADLSLTPVDDLPEGVDSIERICTNLKRTDHFRKLHFTRSKRVPIVTGVHKATGVHFDLAMSNTAARKNSLLQYHYMSKYPSVLPPLIRTVKVWAERHGILGAPRGALCSYGYVLLYIRYKQETDPDFEIMDERLHALPAKTRNSREFDAFNPSLAELRGFFAWLSNFDARRYVIDVRADPARITHRHEANFDNDDFSLGIVEPYDDTFNVAHAVTPASWRRMRSEARRAVALIDAGDIDALFAKADDDDDSSDE